MGCVPFFCLLVFILKGSIQTPLCSPKIANVMFKYIRKIGQKGDINSKKLRSKSLSLFLIQGLSQFIPSMDKLP